MRRFALVVSMMFVLGLAAMAEEGKAAPGLKIGDACPTFQSLQCACGKVVSADDFKHDALVICITCNHCPVAVAYEDRIIDFCKKHAGENGKVGFIAINVNNTEADSLPKMKERFKEKNFNFYYAIDPSQKIARDLGAKVTPHFFVFNKERKLVYMGAMDDNMDASKATRNFVEEACVACINGTMPKMTSTQAKGCGIKWDKK